MTAVAVVVTVAVVVSQRRRLLPPGQRRPETILLLPSTDRRSRSVGNCGIPHVIASVRENAASSVTENENT